MILVSAWINKVGWPIPKTSPRCSLAFEQITGLTRHGSSTEQELMCWSRWSLIRLEHAVRETVLCRQGAIGLNVGSLNVVETRLAPMPSQLTQEGRVFVVRVICCIKPDRTRIFPRVRSGNVAVREEVIWSAVLLYDDDHMLKLLSARKGRTESQQYCQYFSHMFGVVATRKPAPTADSALTILHCPQRN
jgi:hypothetical protein